MTALTREDLLQLAMAEGFADVGVAGVELPEDEAWLQQWLAAGMHGEMGYMARHGTLRSRPDELKPGTLRVISLRMDYWPEDAADAATVLADPSLGYLSRYALGRDYHKVMRQGLARVAEAIAARIPHAYRVFVDSGRCWKKRWPAMQASAGSASTPTSSHAMPARISSWEKYSPTCPCPSMNLPARIAAAAPPACRPAQPMPSSRRTSWMRGAAFRISPSNCAVRFPWNCALPSATASMAATTASWCVPWNKFARAASHPDFRIRHGLDAPQLTQLLGWTREDFEQRFEGSAVRRIGHEAFIRNVAVALGNGPADAAAMQALRERCSDSSELIAEHARWALDRLAARGERTG